MRPLDICARMYPLPFHHPWRASQASTQTEFWNEVQQLGEPYETSGRAAPHVDGVRDTDIEIEATLYRRVPVSHPEMPFAWELKPRCHSPVSHPEISFAWKLKPRCHLPGSSSRDASGKQSVDRRVCVGVKRVGELKVGGVGCVGVWDCWVCGRCGRCGRCG